MRLIGSRTGALGIPKGIQWKVLETPSTTAGSSDSQ